MPDAERPPPPPPRDGRSLVDRVLDRLKNNRIAAVVILAAMGVGALASLTDSTRKLADLAGSFSRVEAAGEWKTEAAVFHPYGAEFLRLTLQEAPGGQLVGDVQFSGNEQLRPRRFPVLEGKRNGKSLTLLFDGGDRVRETVTGDLAGDQLRLVYQREGREAVPATAQRVPQASQLLGGRLALIYKRQEFASHQAACTRLLQDLSPPQAYKLSEAPDEHGNVHCVGREGFDMFQNEVQQEVVCPAQSRTTLVAGRRPALAQGCECDVNLVAAGAACVPR